MASQFWRMYTSEQFLHYVALTEDWRHENCDILSRQPEPPEALLIGITEGTWLITEIFEFLAKLGRLGLYRNGVQVSIQLHNTQGRELYVDEVNRIPFAVRMDTQAESIEFLATVSPDEIGQPKALTLTALNYIYDRFGWQPNASLLESEIERLHDVRR